MKTLYISIILGCCLGLFACGNNDSSELAAASDTGVAGSYARFIIVGDFMYVVDDTSIKTFDLTTPAQPEEVDQQPIGERIESIFHFDGRLFVGSGAGLFIYQILEDGKPSQLSATAYFDAFDMFACDPVVANSTHAYVTLNSLDRVETPCGGTIDIDINVLRVFDIADLTQPLLIAEYPMSAPKGVGLDGETLFICDHDQGLKIFDVSNPEDIQLIQQFDTFTAYDVIPLDGLLLVVGPENVYQFDYRDLDNIQLISEIPYGA